MAWEGMNKKRSSRCREEPRDGINSVKDVGKPKRVTWKPDMVVYVSSSDGNRKEGGRLLLQDGKKSLLFL